MTSPLRRFAPSPQGNDTFAAGRRGQLRPLLGVSGFGHAQPISCWPWLAGAFLCVLLSGCTVVAVTSTAVSVTAGAVGLAADAAIGTAKIVGKGVGKAADALMDDGKPDSSGINVRYREPIPGEILPSEAQTTSATITPVSPPSSLQQNY